MSHDVSHEPDADEVEIRGRLIELIDGPAATPPPVPPMPTARPRDWLDDILDSDPAPAPAGPRPIEEPVTKAKATPEPKPHPKATKRAPRGEQHHPRQSLLDAYAHIPRRIRWLIYHASAAGSGWWLGWADWATDTAAWYAAGHWTSPSAWVLYALGLGVLALYRRTRTWASPAAWCAAIPVSSVVLGVLLYGTGYQP